MESKASVPLFGCVEQRIGPVAPSESTFEFLQRGGGPGTIPIRTWMENAFRNVVANRQHALRQRLRAHSFDVFIGAYLELQVHEMLRRCQCSFEYEPEDPESYPADFRVAQGNDDFGIEATTFVRGPRLNEEDFVARLRSNSKLTATLSQRQLSLNLRVYGALEGDVSKQAIHEFVEELCRSANGTNPPGRSSWDPPNAQIQFGGWRCEGRIWSIEGRGGFINPPSRFDDNPLTCLAIRKKLHGKQRRWRKFWEKKELVPGPFLVVTSVDFLVDSSTVKAALYGSHGSSRECKKFVPVLRQTNAAIVFHRAALGAERDAAVQLYRNGDYPIPACLQPLIKRQPLRDLIGM